MKAEVEGKFLQIMADFTQYNKWDSNKFSKEVRNQIIILIANHIQELYSEFFIVENESEN